MFILSPKETFSLKKIILNNKQKTLYRNRQWNNLQITHINNYNEKHFPLLFCNNGTSVYCFDMISAFYSAEEVYYKDFWTLRFNAGVTLRPASKNICSLPAVGNFFFFSNWTGRYYFLSDWSLILSMVFGTICFRLIVFYFNLNKVTCINFLSLLQMRNSQNVHIPGTYQK